MEGRVGRKREEEGEQRVVLSPWYLPLCFTRAGCQLSPAPC